TPIDGPSERSERSRHPRDAEEEPEPPPSQTYADSDRCRAAPADRLLHKHDRREREHPAEVSPSDGEHHEHQGPAAPDAVHPVQDTDPHCPEGARGATPVLAHETDRRTALTEAGVLEGRELEEAGSEQESPRQALRPAREPGRSLDDAMEARVRQERGGAEERPHREVSRAQEREEACGSPG